jgi:hypothetical protein
MAYSLPELVLVGAAQNLVLQTSSIFQKGETCARSEDQDLTGADVEYNELPTW